MSDQAPPGGGADGDAAPAPAVARSNPSRLELAREIEALRLAVREREAWLDELRRDLEERDASLGWRDQEAKGAAAEAAAARREAAQLREDREALRKALQLRSEELVTSNERIQKLETEVRELRVERRRRMEELLELRAQLEAPAPGMEVASERNDARLDEAREARAALDRALEEVRAELTQAKDTLTGLADELAAVKDESATEAAAAAAGRIREIELLQRLSTQGEELVIARQEIAELKAVVQSQKRSPSQPPYPAREGSGDSEG